MSEEAQTSGNFSVLRKAYKEKTDQVTIDMEIPGYDGLLYCRYRLLSLEEMTGITKNDRGKITATNLSLNASSILATCCVQFMYRESPGEELQPLLWDGNPVKYDKELATAIGFEGDNAHEVALGLFSNNDLALVAHASDVTNWARTAGDATFL